MGLADFYQQNKVMIIVIVIIAALLFYILYQSKNKTGDNSDAQHSSPDMQKKIADDINKKLQEISADDCGDSCDIENE